MPSHMGVDLQTHLAYQAELTFDSERLGGKVITVRWTGWTDQNGQPEFTLVDKPALCQLPPAICKSFQLLTVVQAS